MLNLFQDQASKKHTFVMKFTTYTTTFFVTLLSSLVVQAVPLNERDIFDPPILDPHTGTVWTIGQQETVVWDTSNPPKLIAGRFDSLITLRKGGIESPRECDQCSILEHHLNAGSSNPR